MDSGISFILLLAVFVGILKGLTNDRPSFWRGSSEGLAGKGEFLHLVIESLLSYRAVDLHAD